MSRIQTVLGTLFAILLIVCVTALLRSEGDRAALAAVTGVFAAALLISAVLPQLEEFSIGGASAKLRKLEKDVEVLKFLVSGYVTSYELEHLRKLAGAEPFPYERGDTFLEELRRLWRHGLIKKHRHDWYLAQLPERGQLKDYIAVTGRGREYLKLLKSVDADQTTVGDASGSLDA